MHIKRMHKMIEKLTECALCELDQGVECVNTEEFGEVIDMIKDLAEAEYKARISKAMEKSEEEEEAEEKYMLKRFKEEYGEEDGERRYYDNYRYANGRFAPKGRGSYEPRRSGRRGYEEPMYMMTPEMYRMNSPEYYRDMDREQGKMYYSSSSSSGNSGNMSGGSNSGSRYYGGNEGGNRDGREGRSGQSRRSYMETKEMHSDNSPESKQAKMRELENYMKSLSEDLTEAIEGASNEEKTMLKSKLQTLAQKV